LTSFITQASSKPSLDLFPRTCTDAEMIDLRNMVLWSVGSLSHPRATKYACVRYCRQHMP